MHYIRLNALHILYFVWNAWSNDWLVFTAGRRIIFDRYNAGNHVTDAQAVFVFVF